MTSIKFEFISDINCPWCYVCKRNLDMAIESFPDVKFEIEWQPYIIFPIKDEEALPFGEYAKIKFGSEEKAVGIYEKIAEKATESGLNLKFDRMRKYPNSIHGHRLLKWALEYDLQHQMSERLFSANFCEGLNVGNKTVLANLASEVGMDDDVIYDRLSSDEDRHAVSQAALGKQIAGVAQVPFLVVNKKFPITGLETREVFETGIRTLLSQH